MKRIFWFVPACAVFLGILLLSTVLSTPILLDGVDFSDKILHGFAYLVFLVSIGFGLIRSDTYTLKRLVLFSLLVIGYGAALEWVQYTFFPGRYFEWLDALANTTGVVAGSCLIITYRAYF